MSDAAARAMARNMRAERARQHLTQGALAQRLGWSQQKVAALENGARSLYAADLVDVCVALGVPVRALLEGLPGDVLAALGL